MNSTKCYCCKVQEPIPNYNEYGVPICNACHMGIALMSWDKPSKESIDKYRDKMYARAERIKKALAKQGIEWNDPREAK